MTSYDPHRDWLDLLDTDGPFLSVPALKKAWPTGMPGPDRAALDALHDAKPAFEKAWDAWDMADGDDAATLEAYRTARDAWVDVILRTVLGWKNFYLTPASADAEVHSPDYSITVTPTGALSRGDTTGALVLVTDPVESLRAPLDYGLGRQPCSPDGISAPDLGRVRRPRHRRTLVGGRQRPPRDHGRLRHHRLPAMDRTPNRPQRVPAAAAPPAPGRPPER